jgi:hypothetical protein
MQYLSTHLRHGIVLGALTFAFISNAQPVVAQPVDEHIAALTTSSNRNTPAFGRATIVTKPDGESYVQIGASGTETNTDAPRIAPVTLFAPERTASYTTPIPPRHPGKFKKLIFAAGIAPVAVVVYLASCKRSTSSARIASSRVEPKPIAGIVIGSRKPALDQPIHIPEHPWYS